MSLAMLQDPPSYPVSLSERFLDRPLDLEFDLFFPVAALMLDVAGGPDRHGDALSGDLDLEALAALQRVGETAKLFDELVERVILFDVSARPGHFSSLPIAAL